MCVGVEGGVWVRGCVWGMLVVVWGLVGGGWGEGGGVVLCTWACSHKTAGLCVSGEYMCVCVWGLPDSLKSSSEAILTEMSWEKRSFWGRARPSGRLAIGSFFSHAAKVLKASR